MESATVGDLTVSSSHDSAAEIREALTETPAPAVETPEQAPPAEAPAPATTDQPAATEERDPKTGQFKPKQAPGKPRNDPQSRIDQAIARQKEAERRAADLEARLRERESARPDPPPPPKPPAPIDDDPEPNPDDAAVYPDGQFDRKYLKDQARWEARQEYKTAETVKRRFEEERAHRKELETAATQFSDRLSAAEASDPGFMDRVHPKLANAKPTSALLPGERATFANFLAEQVFRSEHPKDLMLHLSDESVVQRLATLPPLQVVRDLAMFEARLGAASPAATVPAAVSHARAPITPLGSSPHAADPYDTSDENLPIEEHIRRENARERAGGRR